MMKLIPEPNLTTLAPSHVVLVINTYYSKLMGTTFAILFKEVSAMEMRILKLCWVLGLWALLAYSYVSYAQDKGLPFIKNYSSKDYSGGSQNWCIVQDRLGLIYVGNSTGVLEYDGTNWRVIRVPNKSAIRSLAVGEDNNIYVGAKGDLGLLKPNIYGQLTYSSLHDYIDSAYQDYNDVWDILIKDGKVYFSTYKYLFCWDGKSISVIKPQSAFHRAFLVHNEIFIRDRNVGLMKLNGDRLEKVSGGELFSTVAIYFMIPVSSDKILIGTRKEGLLLYNGTNPEKFETTVDDSMIEGQIYSGIQLPSGDFAIGTLRQGLFIFSENGMLRHKFDKASTIQDNTILYLMNDRQDGLWVGLNDGLSRLELASPFTRFDESLGVSGIVTSIAREKEDLYIGTTQGLQILEPWKQNQQGQQISTKSNFISIDGLQTQVWHLMSTNGSLLIATSRGVYNYDGKTLTRITQNVSFFLHKSEMDSNRVYIGLNDGLEGIYYSNGRWESESKMPNIYEEIRTIAEAKPGEIWLGTAQEGTIKLAGVTVSKYGTQHGLPNGYTHVSPVNNKITFSTYNGVYKFDEVTKVFSRDSSIPVGPRQVSIVVQGYQSDLFIISASENKTRVNYGFESNEGEYLLDDNVFLRLPKMDIYGILTEPLGVTWFGGTEGVIRFDHAVKPSNAGNYNVHIRQVTVNADSLVYAGLSFDETITSLAYKDNNIGFEFSATSFDGYDNNQYKHMLVGFDETWSGWSYDTKKDYTNIPEGTYLFKVLAKNVFDFESQVASFQFKVYPPWYRSFVAYVVYMILIVFFMALIVRINAKRLRRANLDLEVRIRSRTAEIRKKNSLLQEQKVEILRQTEELAKKAEELHQANHEITLINSNLENTVAKRTQEIKNKNAQLLNYAFSNAHKVRGPLSRILGLIQLIKMDKTSKKDLPLYLNHIHQSANELDNVIKEINVRLEKDDSIPAQKTKTGVK